MDFGITYGISDPTQQGEGSNAGVLNNQFTLQSTSTVTSEPSHILASQDAIASLSESASATYNIHAPGNGGTGQTVSNVDAEVLYSLSESESAAFLSSFAVSPYFLTDADHSDPPSNIYPRKNPTMAIDGSAAFVSIIANALASAKKADNSTSINTQLSSWFTNELTDIMEGFEEDPDVSGAAIQFGSSKVLMTIELEPASASVEIDPASGARSLLNALTESELQKIFNEITTTNLDLYVDVPGNAPDNALLVNALPLKNKDTITFVFDTVPPATTQFSSNPATSDASGGHPNTVYSFSSGGSGSYVPAARRVALTLQINGSATSVSSDTITVVSGMREAGNDAPVGVPAGVPSVDPNTPVHGL
jgi:hypothetical protein